MGLIVLPAAQLVLCKGCGMHGHLVFGDGSKSEEFHSREKALEEVSVALLARKIVGEEADSLTEEIRTSSLFFESQLDDLFWIMISRDHATEEERSRPLLAEEMRPERIPRHGRPLH